MFYKYYVPKGVLKDEAKMTQLPGWQNTIDPKPAWHNIHKCIVMKISKMIWRCRVVKVTFTLHIKHHLKNFFRYYHVKISPNILPFFSCSSRCSDWNFVERLMSSFGNVMSGVLLSGFAHTDKWPLNSERCTGHLKFKSLLSWLSKYGHAC